MTQNDDNLDRNLDHNLDNALFDRLVDGELSATERQQLLASLDDPQGAWRDQGWRKCALAFLEAQTWGVEFKQMLAQPTEKQSLAISLPRSKSSPAPIRWLAITASLLLAFSIGWLTKSPPASSQQAADIAHIERQEMPLRDELPDEALAGIDSEDAVTLLVRDVSGKNQRLRVPLMEVEALDDQFADSVPAGLRERFRNRGFDVQQRRRFAPMFFEQNQQLVPMVVPVDDTYLVPVSQEVF